MKLKIKGEVVEVKKVFTGGYLPLLDCDNGCEYYVASDSGSAGDAAAEYWEDMAQDDPKEFTCIIGEERLVGWAIGWSDSFGISSLQEFLDVTATVPEEQWASYDGKELEVEEIEELDEDELAEYDQLWKHERFLEGDADPGWDMGEAFDGDKLDNLREKKAEYDEWQELIEELGFTPTVAYRHN